MNDFPAKSDIEILVKLQEAETQIVRLKAVLIKVEKEKEKIKAELSESAKPAVKKKPAKKTTKKATTRLAEATAKRAKK